MASRATRNQARETNLAKKYSQSNQGVTTVMIRNIPKEYTQDELIEEVTNIMGREPFDFFYLPWDFQHNANVGYAFVNFHRSKSAYLAMKLFTKYKFKQYASSKSGEASAAHIQGLENNLRHLEHRAVVHENHPCSPIVMWKGQKIEVSVIFQVMRSLDAKPRAKAPRSAVVAGSAANLNQPQFSDCGTHSEGFAQLLDIACGLVPDDGQDVPHSDALNANSFIFGGVQGQRPEMQNLGGMGRAGPSHGQGFGMQGGGGSSQVDDFFEDEGDDTFDAGASSTGLSMQMPSRQMAPMSWPMHTNAQRIYQPNANAYVPPHAPVPESPSQENSGQGVPGRVPPAPLMPPQGLPGGPAPYTHAGMIGPPQGTMGRPPGPMGPPQGPMGPAQGQAAFQQTGPAVQAPYPQTGPLAPPQGQPAYVPFPQGMQRPQQHFAPPGSEPGAPPGGSPAHQGAPPPPGYPMDPNDGVAQTGPAMSSAVPPMAPAAPGPWDAAGPAGPVVREIRVPRSQEDALQKYLKKFGDL